MLETPRLLLRPMREDDADALLGISADPAMMAAFGVPPFDRAQMARWLRRNRDHQAGHGDGLSPVIPKERGPASATHAARGRGPLRRGRRPWPVVHFPANGRADGDGRARGGSAR